MVTLIWFLDHLFPSSPFEMMGSHSPSVVEHLSKVEIDLFGGNPLMLHHPSFVFDSSFSFS